MLVGFPAAEQYLGFDGHPTTIYVRSVTSQTAAVQSVLAATANPEAPNEVNVSQPSAALTARADAQGALNSLFLGLGAVSLLVGAVGVANIMLIGVLERRSEIGLRRALGATKGNIRTQFLSEAILLALIGGAVGVTLGSSRPPSTRHQALADRHPHHRLGGRPRRRHPDRRRRRAPARDPRRPHVPDRGAADRHRTRTVGSALGLAAVRGSGCLPRAAAEVRVALGRESRNDSLEQQRQRRRDVVPAGYRRIRGKHVDGRGHGGAAGVRYTACIRSHGFPHYPDPTFGPGGMVSQGTSRRDGMDPRPPIFRAAQKTCQSNRVSGG